MGWIRYYPNEEGYTKPDGTEYPDKSVGMICTELSTFIQTIKDICHTLNYSLDITSLNHGEHCGHSMHFKGLAMDYNIYKGPTPLSFDDQANVAKKAAIELNYNIWLWVNDMNTHSHVSVHP